MRAILAPSWGAEGDIGSRFKGPRGILVPSGGVLEAVQVGSQKVILAPGWEVTSWLQVAGSGGHLGSKLGVKRPSWVQVGRSHGHLGFKLGGLTDCGGLLSRIWSQFY